MIKMLGFMLISLALGGAIAWFFSLKKKDRKLIWNRKMLLTILIIFVTICVLFGIAAFGSMFSLKLF